MRRTISIGLFLGSLLLAACHGSSASQTPPGGSAGGGGSGGGGGSAGGGGGGVDPGSGSGGTTVTPPGATLTVADPTGATGPFAIDQLEKLTIRVDCEHLEPGDHIVRVDVTSPEGTLYAQVSGTLVASDAGTGSRSALLQVRGSTIDTFRELGAWHLVANLDGTPLTAASIDFAE